MNAGFFCRAWWPALLLALAACSRPPAPPAPGNVSGGPAFPEAPSGPPVAGDWVVQQIGNDPDTLNPVTSQDSTARMIQDELYDTLLHVDNETLRLVPSLAESYEISPDHLVYTFHLRRGVTWHDGAPLTADDVRFSYERVQDPKVDDAPLRSYFSTIRSCEAPDPSTVRFTATERYFKTLQVLGEMPIVPRHVLEKGEPDFNRHPFGRAPVGTGPYRFVRWRTGSEVVLERYDGYWNAAAAPHYPRRLVYRIIQDSYVAAQLLKKGELDVVAPLSPTQWIHEMEPSRAMTRLRQIVYPYPAYSYLGFNLRRPVFADIRVRHAVDLLIPRDDIVTKLYFNQYATKTSGYDPPGQPSYNPDVPPTPYDPAQARQLLAEAGWRDDHGDGFLYKDGQRLGFSLLFPAGSTGAQKVCELVQESLRAAGIDLRLTSLEFVQLIARIEDWDYDAMLGSWSLDVNGDPTQLWSGAQAKLKKSSNFIGYANPEADRLMAAARLEYDDAGRAALYRQLQQVIHDDYPVCFLFNPRQIMVVSRRFQDVKTFVPRPCFDPGTWWVPAALRKYPD